MRKTLIAAALGASMGIDFGRRDSTGVCVLSKDGKIIDIKTMDSKIQGQEPDLIIIDDIPPMVSEEMMDQIIDMFGDSNHGIEPHQGHFGIRGQNGQIIEIDSCLAHDELLLHQGILPPFTGFNTIQGPLEPPGYDGVMKLYLGGVKSRPAFTSEKPMTKRQKRRAKGKKQC